MRVRTRHVVAGVIVVALAAGAAGFVIGRATKTGAAKGPTRSWRPLPRAPIAGRIAEGVVWTGRELIVWGGVARGREASDGAAYDPATRTWHTIAPPPAHVGGSAVWTGETAVAWSGNSPDGPAVGAVYDPRADSWRRLPAGPLGPRELYSSVWTGRELLIVGGAGGDTYATPVAAAVDPRTGTWRRLPAFDHLKGFLPNGAVWDGHEVLVFGNLALCPERGSACDRHRALFVAYNPSTDTLRELTLPAPSETFGSDTAASLTPIAWTRSEVVFTASLPGSMRVIRYNPTIGGWNKKVTTPCHVVENPTQGHGCRDWRMGPYAQCYLSIVQTAWAGNSVVAPCGKDGLQIFDLATNAWRTITAGPSPFNSRWSSAVVWTGKELIVWSGSTNEKFNPTPGDGASLTLKN